MILLKTLIKGSIAESSVDIKAPVHFDVRVELFNNIQQELFWYSQIIKNYIIGVMNND